MIQEFDKNKLDLVKKKEFYPFEYMTDFGKFKEKLPGKEKFYSSLTGKKNTGKEYDHVLKVWSKFEMKTMKDCHDLYFKMWPLLLGDVFEKFINKSLKNYGLCRSHLSAPGLNWDAMLKMTKVKLELVSDPGMYIFLEEGTRGGISYISNIF